MRWQLPPPGGAERLAPKRGPQPFRATASSVKVRDYLNIQHQLRVFQAHCPIRFASVIEMEQFIWHPI